MSTYKYIILQRKRKAKKLKEDMKEGDNDEDNWSVSCSGLIDNPLQANGEIDIKNRRSLDNKKDQFLSNNAMILLDDQNESQDMSHLNLIQGKPDEMNLTNFRLLKLKEIAKGFNKITDNSSNNSMSKTRIQRSRQQTLNKPGAISLKPSKLTSTGGYDVLEADGTLLETPNNKGESINEGTSHFRNSYNEESKLRGFEMNEEEEDKYEEIKRRDELNFRNESRQRLPQIERNNTGSVFNNKLIHQENANKKSKSSQSNDDN
jgi:hypothetical protein